MAIVIRNLLTECPHDLPTELSEILVSENCVRVERIVSLGHVSPEGFWYDQPEHEWVAILAGEAKLRFDDREDLIRLGAGDWINIPAHRKHRVEWTTPERPTIWLAVFYHGGK